MADGKTGRRARMRPGRVAFVDGGNCLSRSWRRFTRAWFSLASRHSWETEQVAPPTHRLPQNRSQQFLGVTGS